MTLGFPINPTGASSQSITDYWATFLKYAYVLGNGHSAVNKEVKSFSFKDLSSSVKDGTDIFGNI